MLGSSKDATIAVHSFASHLQETRLVEDVSRILVQLHFSVSFYILFPQFLSKNVGPLDRIRHPSRLWKEWKAEKQTSPQHFESR